MNEPIWLVTARKYIGTREVKGARHNPVIVRMWARIRAVYTDDETPWCASFVGSVLEECGIRSTRSAAAGSYRKWGRVISGPAPGAIGIKARKGGNHVAFAHKLLGGGLIAMVGGNQDDCVSSAPYNLADFDTWVWPIGPNIPEPVYFARASMAGRKRVASNVREA